MCNNVFSDDVQVPLVSVTVITYNHAPYIRDCLDGILSQKTSFPFEVIVHDDASTDGTSDIVREYKQRFPQQIVAVLQKENQYSKGVDILARYIRPLIRRKYRALCEGDDFWHRTDKLQRQIEILEDDPSVALVATDVDALVMRSGRRIRACMKRAGHLDKLNHVQDMTASLLKREIGLFTCSACMRSDPYFRMRQANAFEFSRNFKMGDVQTWWELSRLGKVVVIPESMATYRVLQNSASHSPDRMKTYDFYVNSLELHEHYVQKFGYGKDMLEAVRQAHYGILGDLALRLKREDLRQKTLGLVGQIASGRSLGSRVVAWGLQTQRRFRSLAVVWPLIEVGCKTYSRCLRQATRLSQQFKIKSI